MGPACMTVTGTILPSSVKRCVIPTFVPRIPGRYELRISIPGANTYVSQDFYSYGRWGWSDDNSFEVSNEGNVEVDLDKKSYLAGETVAAFFKVPFSGRMLVTMETDHVVSHQYLDVSNRTASIDLKLSADHVPNVYITAIVTGIIFYSLTIT